MSEWKGRRDQFAMAALASTTVHLPSGDYTDSDQMVADRLANWAFQVADACMEKAPSLNGPYGYLVMPPGLDESEWTLESDPITDQERAEGYRCVPLYAQQDPFAALAARKEK